MILDAQVDEQITKGFTYRWQIGGAVLRQLEKSGIKYLVLKADDYVTVLPAEGFLAGEKYTELKMQGTSTRRFSYDVVMQRLAAPDAQSGETDLTDEEQPLYETAVSVTVAEETTVLTEDELQPMYMFGVYSGAAELLEVPYGMWTPEGETDEAKEAVKK